MSESVSQALSNLISALGGAKGIIALLVFLGINGGWFYHSETQSDYTKKVENQVSELAVMASTSITEKESYVCPKPTIDCRSQPYR